MTEASNVPDSTDAAASEKKAEHDYRDPPAGRAPRCARCGVATFDAPWEFVVIWNPEVGALPAPILHLFRTRSTVSHTDGRAVHQTDQGHGTFYVGAVQTYLSKYQPERTDIKAEASEMPCSPG